MPAGVALAYVDDSFYETITFDEEPDEVQFHMRRGDGDEVNLTDDIEAVSATAYRALVVFDCAGTWQPSWRYIMSSGESGTILGTPIDIFRRVTPSGSGGASPPTPALDNEWSFAPAMTDSGDGEGVDFATIDLSDIGFDDVDDYTFDVVPVRSDSDGPSPVWHVEEHTAAGFKVVTTPFVGSFRVTVRRVIV